MADEKDDESGLYAEVSETTPTARFHIDENKSYAIVDKAAPRTAPRTAPASDGSKKCPYCSSGDDSAGCKC